MAGGHDLELRILNPAKLLNEACHRLRVKTSFQIIDKDYFGSIMDGQGCEHSERQESPVTGRPCGDAFGSQHVKRIS
ncbi:MAG: hypothetical protein QOF89_6081 [Acidobacteriota bacterium]|nr:hypothetical protein [Acidobacteriota bacterium]